MHLRVLTRAASTAILAAVILTSCSSDPEVAAPPDPSPSETVAPETPEPRESAAPESESAEEFIRRWVGLQNAMQTDGDTQAYRAASPECQTCLQFSDRIEEIYAAGGTVETTGWDLGSDFKVAGEHNHKLVQVMVKSGETQYSEAEGAPTKRLPGGLLKQQFDVIKVKGNWTMLEYSEVAQ